MFNNTLLSAFFPIKHHACHISLNIFFCLKGVCGKIFENFFFVLIKKGLYKKEHFENDVR